MVPVELAVTIASVQYPAMREEIKYAVCALSDEGFQVQVWSEGTLPRDNYLYDFDQPFHALLDDIDLFTSGESLIGKVLVNVTELRALEALGTALRNLVSDIGRSGSFEQACVSEYWPAVLETARLATSVIGRPPDFP